MKCQRCDKEMEPKHYLKFEVTKSFLPNGWEVVHFMDADVCESCAEDIASEVQDRLENPPFSV